MQVRVCMVGLLYSTLDSSRNEAVTTKNSTKLHGEPCFPFFFLPLPLTTVVVPLFTHGHFSPTKNFWNDGRGCKSDNFCSNWFVIIDGICLFLAINEIRIYLRNYLSISKKCTSTLNLLKFDT